jgi:periplasmic divalent cation tolerance protein
MYEIAYITAGSRSEAKKIARTLLEEKLIACANIFDVESLYWWRGAIEQGAESILVCKTTAGKRRRLMAVVRRIHSYENPCVVFFKITAGSDPFLNWVRDSTKN